MEVNTFLTNFREAFGEKVNLPIAVWYSDAPINKTEAPTHCFFTIFDVVLKGESASMNASNIRCRGGKYYTGYCEVPEFVPTFVALKERYKRTPEMVVDYVEKLNTPEAQANYLNFARIDKIENFDNVEIILFFATPDVLSGLTTWCYFDNNSEDAVSAIFGSGCAASVTQPLVENRRGGRRTFLGMFDPSVRPQIDAGVLSYAIPMSRFKEMYRTMRDSCLFDTRAWTKVKERINK